MAADHEVSSVCVQLVQAVQIMMDPSVPQSQRMEAYNKCEHFKQSSPLVVECALALTRPEQNQVVRHFGLKLLEETIRLRWNDMSPDQKLFIKETAMRMISEDMSLSELLHIKDAVARIVVEMAKREWPQHWPTLLGELDQLCRKGETQTEMAMFIMLRLVEDVVLLQTLEQQQRRKEIYAALTANMEQIFAFLLGLLEKHYKAYVESRSEQHCKVCQAVLNTFTAFIEWVPISHVMANDKYLLRCLCHLLSDDRLQMNAAECLLAVVSWKGGKVNDRMQIMCLFNRDMMAPLFDAVGKANQKALAEEAHYHFLKKMVQILAELGGQVVVVWVVDNKAEKATESKRPENFNVYLDALLAFSAHPSHTVSMMANELWNKFFRHVGISKDEVFKGFIPKWVDASLKKSVKVGQPSRSDHPSCAYSVLDFDTDQEFNVFFAKYRVILFEGLRLVSFQLSPTVPYMYVEAWLKQVLSQPINLGHGVPVGGFCNVDSPTYLELDAIGNCLEAILSKLTVAELEESVLTSALNLAKACLEFTTPDPALASVVLSCASSLFPSIAARADTMLLPTLNKIFSCITFTGGAASIVAVSKETRMLRRHGSALLVKLSTRYPRVFLPLFDHLRNNVVQMKERGEILRSEFSTLVEALVLISNEFHNYQTQSDFIKFISEPVCIQFRNLQQVISSPAAFMDFIGLTRSADTGEASPQHQDNRSELQFTLNFILAVMRRASYPTDDLVACRNGGFVISESDGAVSLRNPAWEVSASVLPQVFTLAKTITHLWSPESIAKLHPDFTKVLEMQEAEKNSMCEVGNREESREIKTKTALSRMQTFVFETFENNYLLLTQLCSSCGLEFYQQPQLSAGVTGYILTGLHLLPDYRLRVVNRFLKALVNKCPKLCYSPVLAPVLQSFLPYMYERLMERWKHVVSLREATGFDEDNTDSQEVMDDVVCRNLSREFLDVVKAILTSGGGSDLAVASFGGPRSENSENASGAASNSNGNGGNGGGHHAPQLSELGSLVLQHESLGQGVFLTLVQALQWPDSQSSVRASNLVELVLPVLVSTERLGDADASQVFTRILMALHELGKHETNYIALIQLAMVAYETLRPKYPGVVEVLARVPGCNQDDLTKFDQRVMQAAAQQQQKKNGGQSAKGGEKAKKDMFKKLIGHYIAKDVSNLFKHDVVIKNLPSLQLLKPARQKTPSLEETEKTDIGLGTLFAAHNGKQ